ncbi:unnamed protein product [Orchesella dallaii]|uniref:RING-type domain-containing protein n=1 Tax=Orchesella dallaii TaxID=48710 RepID=A0ABP1QMM8_9HEXA
MSEEESAGDIGGGQNESLLDAVSRYIGNYNENNSTGGNVAGYDDDDGHNREDFSSLLGLGEGGLTISFRDVLVGMVLPQTSVSSTTTSSNVSSSHASDEEPFYSSFPSYPSELLDGGNSGSGESQSTRCSNLEEYKCPICLDTFINTVRVDCSYGHKFCNFCIQCWIQIGSHLVTECPVCRDPIFGKRLDLKTDAEIRSIVEQLTEAEKSERLLAIKERLQNEFPNVNFHEYPGVEFNPSGSNARAESTHQDLRSTLFNLGRSVSVPTAGVAHGFAGRCPFSSYPMISGRNDSFSHATPWSISSSTSLSNGDAQGNSRTYNDDPYQLLSSQTSASNTGIWNSEVTPASDETFPRSGSASAPWFPAPGLASNTPNGLHQPSYATATRSISEHNCNHNAFSSSSHGYFTNRSSTAPNVPLHNQHLNPVNHGVTSSVETSAFNSMTYGLRPSQSFPCYLPSSSVAPSASTIMNTNSACGYQHHACYLPSCSNYRSTMSTHQLPPGDIGHSVHMIPPSIQNSYAHGQQQIPRNGSGDASQVPQSPNSSFWDTSASTVVLNNGVGTGGSGATPRLTPRMPGRHCMSFQLPRPVVTSSSPPPPQNSCRLSSPPDLTTGNGGNLQGVRGVGNDSSSPPNEERNGRPTNSQVGFRPTGSGSCHHHHYHYIQNLEASTSTSPPSSSRPLPTSASASAPNGYGAPPPSNASGRGTLRVSQYPSPAESAHFSGGFSLFSGGYIGFQINHIPTSVDDRVRPVPGRITHPLVSLVPLNSDGSSTRISLTFEVHRA